MIVDGENPSLKDRPKKQAVRFPKECSSLRSHRGGEGGKYQVHRLWATPVVLGAETLFANMYLGLRFGFPVSILSSSAWFCFVTSSRDRCIPSADICWLWGDTVSLRWLLFKCCVFCCFGLWVFLLFSFLSLHGSQWIQMNYLTFSCFPTSTCIRSVWNTVITWFIFQFTGL